MSCFLRASVLLSQEQNGTVDIANKYKFSSILTIYINHPTRTEEADTIRMVYSMVSPEYMSTSYKKSQNLITHPRVMVESQGSVSWDGFYSAVQNQKAVSAYM